MTKRTKSEHDFFTAFLLLTVAASIFFVVVLFYPAGNQWISFPVSENSKNESDPGDKELAAQQEMGPKKFETTKPKVENPKDYDQPISTWEPLGAEQDVEVSKPIEQKTSPVSSDDQQQAQLREAIDLIDSGRATDAKLLLEEILAVNPHHEGALIEMGMIHLIDLKQPDQALSFLENAAKINPSNSIIVSELINIYEELGRSEAGLAFLKGIQEEHPDNSAIASSIGQMLSNQGRAAEAVPYLEKASESKDYSENILIDLADAYMATGQPDKAISAYRKAIEDEQLRFSESYLGVTKGEDYSESGLQKQKDLVRILIREKRFDEAEIEVNLMREKAPNDTGVMALGEQLKRQRAQG